MAKINVISGFLGAGKTTLIKKLLKEALADEKVVLIENEFGEIGIDGGFMQDAGVQVTEMNSGCICCSLVGDFGEALKKVVAQFAPDRILIEPSGVGKLSDVMAAIKKSSEECDLVLNSATTVADAQKCKIYMKNFGEFYDNQIENAGAVILSRTQSVSQEKLDQAVALIREKNPKARILTTPWDELTGARILEVMENAQDLTLKLMEEAHRKNEEEEAEWEKFAAEHPEEAARMEEEEEEHHHHHHHHDHEEEEHEHHHHDHDDDDDEEEEHEHHHHHHHHHHHGEGDHDADEIFTSWGRETAKKFDRAALTEALDKLSESNEFGAILRAKGIVQTTDGSWVEFDMVPENVEIREGSPDYTSRLCVIGAELKEDRIEELFGL